MTKREWGKVIVKTMAFLLIGAVLFHLCHSVLVEKTSYRKYRSWRAAENVDVLILGNSHADNGLRGQDLAAGLEEAAGGTVDVFNYAVFGMRMEQAYFFAKELLSSQTPDLIILETYAFCPLADEHREIVTRQAFDLFPLSRNKVDAIRYCIPKEDRASYYIPLMKYHTRWKELTGQDIALLWDEELWRPGGGNGVLSGETCPDPGDGWFSQIPDDGEQPLTPTEAECLERLLALLEEKDIPLLLVSLPYRRQMGMDSLEQVRINNYLRSHYVNGGTVQLLDMNRMWAELDVTYADLLDEGHANAAGADKFTACLLEYMKAHCDPAGLAS